MSRYKVQSIGNVTPGILGFVLERGQYEKPFAFLPGQYATISFHRHHRPSAARCFSIASSPTEQDILEFGVRIGGKYTKALTKLVPGDTVDVDGPYGSFIFDAHTQKEIVMCAGGIGITPFISMMRYATQLRLENKLTLILSVRTQNDIPYFEELKHMAADNPNLRLMFIIGDGETNLIQPPHTLYTGRITREVLHDASGSDFTKQAFFICGPPPFMKGASDLLKDQNVEGDRIITEAFSQGHHKQTGRSRGWPFNIYVIGAVGTLATSMIVMGNDLMKSIPPSILPTTLKTDPLATVGREQDLDAVVNSLQSLLSAATKSPEVAAAELEVQVAQAKVDEVNAQNAAISTGQYAQSSYSGSTSSSASTSSSSSSSSSVTPAPTPTPVKVPVCTTSASGVKTCK